jgi:hypothetical protein
MSYVKQHDMVLEADAKLAEIVAKINETATNKIAIDSIPHAFATMQVPVTHAAVGRVLLGDKEVSLENWQKALAKAARYDVCGMFRETESGNQVEVMGELICAGGCVVLMFSGTSQVLAPMFGALLTADWHEAVIRKGKIWSFATETERLYLFVAQRATLPPLNGAITFIVPTTLETYHEILSTTGLENNAAQLGQS